MMDAQALEEERMRAEESIYNTHLDAVKEEVQLIQREGEMITIQLDKIREIKIPK